MSKRVHETHEYQHVYSSFKTTDEYSYANARNHITCGSLSSGVVVALVAVDTLRLPLEDDVEESGPNESIVIIFDPTRVLL